MNINIVWYVQYQNTQPLIWIQFKKSIGKLRFTRNIQTYYYNNIHSDINFFNKQKSLTILSFWIKERYLKKITLL